MLASRNVRDFRVTMFRFGRWQWEKQRQTLQDLKLEWLESDGILSSVFTVIGPKATVMAFEYLVATGAPMRLHKVGGPALALILAISSAGPVLAGDRDHVGALGRDAIARRDAFEANLNTFRSRGFMTGPAGDEASAIAASQAYSGWERVVHYASRWSQSVRDFFGYGGQSYGHYGCYCVRGAVDGGSGFRAEPGPKGY